MTRTARCWTALLVVLGTQILMASGSTPGTVRWMSVLPSAGTNDVAMEGNRVFAAGNVADATGNSDLLVRALDAATGAVVWQDRLDVARRYDAAEAIAVRGGVVVAGGRVTNAAGNRDAFVRAYDARSGVVLWQNQFNFANRSDEFSFHTIGLGGESVVLGGLVRQANNNAEWFVRAYSLATGTLLWQDTADGGSFDHTVSVVAHGSLVFAGGVMTDATLMRHFTVRAYDAATGVLLWQDKVPIGSLGFFFAADVAWELAAEGNRLFAAGSITDGTGTHLTVRAYDAATGVLRWDRIEDFGAGADVAFSVAASGGRVIAAGSGGPDCSTVTASNCDVLVHAYDQQTGTPLWNVQFDGDGGDDQGNVVRIAGNHVLVGSVVQSPSGDFDWLVQSYDGATGGLEWSDRFASAGGFAYPNQIVTSGSTAIVTGFQSEASGVQDAIVRSYDIR